MAIIQIRARYDYPASGAPGYNIWHLRADTDSPIPEANLASALAALGSFYAPFVPLMWNDQTVTIERDAVNIETREIVDLGATLSLTGTSAAIPQPLATALVVGWRTTQATRSGRGRTFVSGLTTIAADNDGTPAPDALEAAEEAGSVIVDWNGTIDGSAFGVYSPTDGIIRDIVATRTRDSWAVLRSRRD